LTFGEVTKVVAANWNAMSDEKKEVWNRMAADDRERYQREMDAYKGSELEAQWLASLEEDTAEEAKWVAELKAAEEAKWLAELRVAQEEAKVAEAKAREEAAVKELAEAKAREEAAVKEKMEWLTSLETKQETDTDEVQEEAAVEEEEESGELLLNISPGKLGLKIKMDEVLGGVVIVKVLDVCTFKDLVGTGWRIITIDDVPVKSVTDFAFKEGEIEKNRLMKFVKP
jgi:C-terminal processing protease CtpA/Prc